MRRVTTIFDFKRLPGGLLIVMVLFMLTERAVYLSRPNLIADFWNKFLINEHVLTAMPQDFDYIIMGNSLQKTGIDPTATSENLLNLGLPGSKPQALYVLLKRYLQRHKSPKAIFVYVDPEDPVDSLLVILRYFVNIPEFISMWKDLSWQERLCFITRYFASLDTRKVTQVTRETYPHSNKVFVETMTKNRGYMPSPSCDKAIPDDCFATRRVRIQRGLSITSRDMKYLREFMKLADSKKIKVVFLGMMQPKELHDIYEKIGFNEDYLVFVKILKAQYPNAYYVDAPILYMENNYFSDPWHMNKEGVKKYTEYFKDAVIIPFVRRHGR